VGASPAASEPPLPLPLSVPPLPLPLSVPPLLLPPSVAVPPGRQIMTGIPEGIWHVDPVLHSELIMQSWNVPPAQLAAHDVVIDTVPQQTMPAPQVPAMHVTPPPLLDPELDPLSSPEPELPPELVPASLGGVLVDELQPAASTTPSGNT
jgi:hypothetical protein